MVYLKFMMVNFAYQKNPGIFMALFLFHYLAACFGAFIALSYMRNIFMCAFELDVINPNMYLNLKCMVTLVGILYLKMVNICRLKKISNFPVITHHVAHQV